MAVEENTLFEVRLFYVVNGQTCMNVWHYRNTDALPNPITPRDVAIGIANDFGGDANGEIPGEFKKVFASNVTITKLQTQPIWPVRWRAFELPLAVVGTIGAACTAQNVQWTLSKVGELADRHELGSMHVGGVPADAYSGGELTNDHKARADVLKAFLASDLVLGDPVVTLEPVIMNKTPIDGTDPPRYQVSGSSPIMEWIRKDTLRTQRPRTKGIGI